VHCCNGFGQRATRHVSHLDPPLVGSTQSLKAWYSLGHLLGMVGAMLAVGAGLAVGCGLQFTGHWDMHAMYVSTSGPHVPQLHAANPWHVPSSKVVHPLTGFGQYWTTHVSQVSRVTSVPLWALVICVSDWEEKHASTAASSSGHGSGLGAGVPSRSSAICTGEGAGVVADWPRQTPAARKMQQRARSVDDERSEEESRGQERPPRRALGRGSGDSITMIDRGQAGGRVGV
jgi:hypothetical protein